MFPVGLKDWLTGARARITRRGALVVSPVSEHAPPPGQSNVNQYFKRTLTLDNDGINTDQKVDGSTTPQKFSIAADPDFDIHIQLIQILIADGNPGITNEKFGSLNALTNGWSLDVEESGVVTPIVTLAKTNGELIVQSGANTLFGDGVNVNELSNWSANDDAKLIYIPMGEWIDDGLRLGRGTTDTLTSTVNDDLRELSLMEVTVFGHKNLPG